MMFSMLAPLYQNLTLKSYVGYLLALGKVQRGVSTCGSLARVDWLRGILMLVDLLTGWFIFILLFIRRGAEEERLVILNVLIGT